MMAIRTVVPDKTENRVPTFGSDGGSISREIKTHVCPPPVSLVVLTVGWTDRRTAYNWSHRSCYHHHYHCCFCCVHLHHHYYRRHINIVIVINTVVIVSLIISSSCNSSCSSSNTTSGSGGGVGVSVRLVGCLLNVPAPLWLVGCLTSQQHASVFQGWICSDNLTCYHTEIVVAVQTFHLTQLQYTDTGPTSPSTDPITPGAWQGSQWRANF